MEVVRESVLALFLMISALMDIKYKLISKRVIVVFMIAILASYIGDVMTVSQFKRIDTIPYISMLLGALVGVGMLGISILTKGAVGKGDGFVFCVTGIALGGTKNLSLLVMSLFLSSIFCAVLLVLKKVNRKDTIPWIPFVFISYLGGWLIGF